MKIKKFLIVVTFAVLMPMSLLANQECFEGRGKTEEESSKNLLIKINRYFSPTVIITDAKITRIHTSTTSDQTGVSHSKFKTFPAYLSKNIWNKEIHNKQKDELWVATLCMSSDLVLKINMINDFLVNIQNLTYLLNSEFLFETKPTGTTRNYTEIRGGAIYKRKINEWEGKLSYKSPVTGEYLWVTSAMFDTTSNWSDLRWELVIKLARMDLFVIANLTTTDEYNNFTDFVLDMLPEDFSIGKIDEKSVIFLWPDKKILVERLMQRLDFRYDEGSIWKNGNKTGSILTRLRRPLPILSELTVTKTIWANLCECGFRIDSDIPTVLYSDEMVSNLNDIALSRRDYIETLYLPSGTSVLSNKDLLISHSSTFFTSDLHGIIGLDRSVPIPLTNREIKRISCGGTVFNNDLIRSFTQKKIIGDDFKISLNLNTSGSQNFYVYWVYFDSGFNKIAVREFLPTELQNRTSLAADGTLNLTLFGIRDEMNANIILVTEKRMKNIRKLKDRDIVKSWFVDRYSISDVKLEEMLSNTGRYDMVRFEW